MISPEIICFCVGYKGYKIHYQQSMTLHCPISDPYQDIVEIILSVDFNCLFKVFLT